MLFYLSTSKEGIISHDLTFVKFHEEKISNSFSLKLWMIFHFYLSHSSYQNIMQRDQLLTQYSNLIFLKSLVIFYQSEVQPEVMTSYSRKH